MITKKHQINPCDNPNPDLMQRQDIYDKAIVTTTHTSASGIRRTITALAENIDHLVELEEGNIRKEFPYIEYTDVSPSQPFIQNGVVCAMVTITGGLLV